MSLQFTGPPNMEISLRPEHERFIEQRIKSGKYADAAAVIDDALGLLRITPRSLDELGELLDVGIQQLDRGEGITLRNEQELKAFFDDIKARGRQRLAARKHAS